MHAIFASRLEAITTSSKKLLGWRPSLLVIRMLLVAPVVFLPLFLHVPHESVEHALSVLLSFGVQHQNGEGTGCPPRFKPLGNGL